MFRLMVSFLFASLLTLGSVANAAHIDLTGSAGAAVAATGVHNDADVGAVKFTAGPGKSVLTHSTGSGLGIDCAGLLCGGDNPYQIDFPEVLTIEFETSVLVKSVGISNLYFESWHILYYPEYGFGASDTYHVFSFNANDATDGYVSVDLGFSANRLVLWAGSAKDVDWSFADIDVASKPRPGPGPSNPIPEPGAGLAFSLGAIALSLFTRKV